MKVIRAKQFLNKKSASQIETNNEQIDRAVLEIIRQVRQNGDKSLFQYTKEFDKVALNKLTVSAAEFAEAKQQVDDNFLIALKQAKENITEFHQAQKEQSWFIDQANGVTLGQKVTPIEKVGIYIPGGKAAYPSSVLMNVIPAKLAGVQSISIVTPPQADGKINPHVLVAAQLSGVDQIYKLGGAQAIAALAYGTETVDKVQKIVGPGNAFVARAKKWVYGDVAIDMIAGPSEICIVADDAAQPSFVAADLLSQAEHDEAAVCICITTSTSIAEQVAKEVDKQMKQLERQDIIKQSIEDNGKIIVVDSLQEAFELVNTIAPEHLQLMTKQPTSDVAFIKNAGAIFLGNYSPEPLGDYYAGPNHTLPTSGTAAFASPLGVYDFVKKSSIIHYSKQALAEAADHIMTIAQVEGLTAHAKSIALRKEA